MLASATGGEGSLVPGGVSAWSGGVSAWSGGGLPGPGGGSLVPGGVCLVGGGLPGRGGGCSLVPGGGLWSRGVSAQHALRQTPPVDRITDACKNITLAQLRCGR